MIARSATDGVEAERIADEAARGLHAQQAGIQAGGDGLPIAGRQRVRRLQARTVDAAAPEEQLKSLLALVRSGTRQDFGSYRKRTLLRRIYRRMGLHRIEALADYIERLRKDPSEMRALAADLTINVTGFFRDPEAWQALADKAGLHRTYVGSVERAERNISIDNIERLAAALNTTATALLAADE